MYRNAEDLLRVCNDNNITISEATLRHEIEESGKPKSILLIDLRKFMKLWSLHPLKDLVNLFILWVV